MRRQRVRRPEADADHDALRRVVDHVQFDVAHGSVRDSTRLTDAQIAAFVRPGGSLFIWVYAQEDSHVVPGMRGAAIRAYM